MNSKIKSSIILGVCSLFVGILGTVGVQKVMNNQNIVTVNINGEKISVDSEEYINLYKGLKTKYNLLEIENKELRDKINNLKTGGTKKDNSFNDAGSIDDNLTWIDQKEPLSVTGDWYTKPREWGNEKDNTGKMYDHGIYADPGTDSKGEIVYYLNKKYSKFEGKIVLPEETKDYTGKTQVKIYLDDEPKYTPRMLTAGVLPKKFSIDVSTTIKLKIIGISVESGTGSPAFGIVDAKFIK